MFDEEVLSSLAYMNKRLQRVQIAQATLELMMNDVLLPEFQNETAQNGSQSDSENEKDSSQDDRKRKAGTLWKKMQGVMMCKCPFCQQESQPVSEPVSDQEKATAQATVPPEPVSATMPEQVSPEPMPEPMSVLEPAQEKATAQRFGDGMGDFAGWAGRQTVKVGTNLWTATYGVGGEILCGMGLTMNLLDPFCTQVRSMSEFPVGDEEEMNDRKKALSLDGAELERVKLRLKVKHGELQEEMERVNSMYRTVGEGNAFEKAGECQQLQYIQKKIYAKLHQLHKYREDLKLTSNPEMSKVVLPSAKPANQSNDKDRDFHDLCVSFLLVHTNVQEHHIEHDQSKGSKDNMTDKERNSLETEFLNNKDLFDDGYDALLDLCVIVACTKGTEQKKSMLQVVNETCAYWLVSDHEKDDVFGILQSPFLQKQSRGEMFAFLSSKPS